MSNPVVNTVIGDGYSIHWDETSPFGARPESVLEKVYERVVYLQDRLPCDENTHIIHHLQQALHWESVRNKLRSEQEVTGTDTPHESQPIEDLLDTYAASHIPQIAYVSERVSLDVELAKKVEYVTHIHIKADDDRGFVVLRTTRDDLDGWKVFTIEKGGVRHQVEFHFFARRDGVSYYRTNVEFLLEGDTICVTPTRLRTKREAYAAQLDALRTA